jgi:ketosteroid isomerase-like protein
MQSWFAKKLLSFNMSRLNAGDARPTLLLDAPDVRFVFPGENSWAGEIHGKAELERWLARFTRLGMKIFPDEVVLMGFPWSQTVCVRGHDYMRTAEGETVYENRYVIWGHLKWGRLKDYEVYEDTQKTEAFDQWLAVHEHQLAAA